MLDEICKKIDIEIVNILKDYSTDERKKALEELRLFLEYYK